MAEAIVSVIAARRYRRGRDSGIPMNCWAAIRRWLNIGADRCELLSKPAACRGRKFGPALFPAISSRDKPRASFRTRSTDSVPVLTHSHVIAAAPVTDPGP